MCEGGVPEVGWLVTVHPPLPCEWGTRLSPHQLQEGSPSHIPAVLGWHQLLTLWCNLTRKRPLHVLASLIPSSVNCVFTLCLFIGSNVSPYWLQGLLYSCDMSFCLLQMMQFSSLCLSAGWTSLWSVPCIWELGQVHHHCVPIPSTSPGMQKALANMNKANNLQCGCEFSKCFSSNRKYEQTDPQ